MRKRLKAFTLIELLVVIAIIALLISILLPSLSRARELSKRLVCGSNMKGIGTSAKIYANDNREKWMIPGFKRGNIYSPGIKYVFDGQSSNPPESLDVGEVGYFRWEESESEDRAGSGGGSPIVSVTRAYWMMVRSGDITVEQFICPSASTDDPDPTENIELYYDFQTYENVSYGYQVPFGPRSTQPREGVDNRLILAADKGPWYFNVQADWNVGKNGQLVTTADSPKSWRTLNSANHGGQGNGEGQNCLYGDGHAAFNKTPAAGIDNDNIYTVMTQDWDTAEGFNRIHGDTPHQTTTDPYPGQDAFFTAENGFCATDSLIYP